MFLRWWRERKRKIFRFFDGTQMRAVDPLRAWMLLLTDPHLEMPRHISELESHDDRISAEAGLIVAAAARRAFGLSEFSAGGSTDQECIDAFQVYLEWLGAQKKTSNSSLTSQQPTGSCHPACQSTTT